VVSDVVSDTEPRGTRPAQEQALWQGRHGLVTPQAQCLTPGGAGLAFHIPASRYLRLPPMGAADGDWPCRRERAEKESLRAVNATGQKGFAMNRDLVQLSRFRRTSRHTESRTDLITCSICLRVLRGAEWMDAERVIREIRSHELGSPPHLRDTVCEACADSIFNRRAEQEPVAA